MKNTSFLLLILLLQFDVIFAQLGGNMNGPYSKNPNNFIPATPEATAFQRYGDLPLSHQNGLSNITIPLGTITLKNFTWPISLSYHSGGNKVGDIASSAGLGWVVNSHGISSSKVVGGTGSQEPEKRFLQLYAQESDGSSSECVYPNEQDVNLAENVLSGAMDFIPDLGYVNTPLFNLTAVGGMFFPISEIKPCSGDFTIGGSTYNFGNGLQDSKGNRYFFGLNTYNTSFTSCYSASGPKFNYGSVLTTIVTFEGGLVSFSYDTVDISYSSQPTQYKTSISPFQCAKCNEQAGQGEVTCDNIYLTKEAYLTKIETSTGDIVRFYYSSRNDLTSGRKLDFIQFNRKIEGVEETLRKYELVHNYFGSGSQPDDLWLKLSSLRLYDKNNSLINAHYFGYDSTDLPNRVQSKAIDWWGYYNGQSSNTSLLPDLSNNRNGDINYAKASILDKITYPTGGSTSIEYEMNPWGGLRIKKLTDWDAATQTTKSRLFNYHTPAGSGYNNGQVFEDFLVNNFLATSNITGFFDVQEENNVYVLSCYMTRINSSPVINTVLEMLPSSDYYPFVTEYFGTDSTGGKIEYRYGTNAQSTGANTPQNIALLDKKVYRNSAGIFEIISQSTFHYDPIYPDTSGIFANPSAPLEQRVWVRDISKQRDEMSYAFQFRIGSRFWCKKFIDNIFCISSMPIKITRTVEKTFDPQNGSNLIDSVFYFYDDVNNLQPTRIRKKLSSGIEQTIRYTYPTGAIPSGVLLTQMEQSALANLIDHNLHHYPYFTEILKNNTVLSKSLNTYHSIHGLPLLKSEKEYPTNSNIYVETQYKNYDSRINITDVQGKDKMNYAMIYDSNDQLVAQCKNAESGSVAYSSFELGNHGYWNGINPSFIQPFGGLTGKKYYSQNSFSISKPGLSITSEYIVTYWSKNGPYNVSGTQAGFPKVLRTLDHSGSTWTLFEHVVSNQSIITVSGSGAIDELRLMPREAEMTTYNYEPSVGLTSQCNKNGQLIFYEYDSAGRLSVVKDEKLNILKTYEYKFGQSQSY